MGGKTKQVARTKNNVKPSSSSRSAELLGTATPSFVGFSAHSELGMVPFAPGFASAEQMPETFDANISSEFQIILRRLSKKDPMTKKKALQEFIDLIKVSNFEQVKSILPVWPKYYHNLANDAEHNVRELTQSVLQLLVLECKRAVAPYLKQLVPVWISSHFDNYVPAASTASNSFRTTFACGGNKRIQEVCLHCQVEILEYTTRNLTFHTPASLSLGKNLTPEEADQKYQRVVICSLKALAFFIEHTSTAPDLSQVKQGLSTLLSNTKFWSFAKHKVTAIKAAWFEFTYQLLQIGVLNDVFTVQKTQLITTTFQNIDDADPLVAPHVWGCILLLQTNYDDWYSSLNIRKALLPKLSTLLRSGFNRNATAVCPNLLPFFAKITASALQDFDLYEFYKRFFDDMLHTITTRFDPQLAKADYAIINKSYFECLRYLLQQLNNNTARTSQEIAFAQRLLEENLLAPIGILLKSDDANVKYFFQHSSALLAFWDRQRSDDVNSFYAQLLNIFWTRIFAMVTQDLQQPNIEGHIIENVLQLVHHLHTANPSLEDQKVKFAEETQQVSNIGTTIQSKSEITPNVAFIEKELKQLVIKLVRICFDKVVQDKSNAYIQRVHLLTRMFGDEKFYESLSDSGNLHGTLDKLVSLFDILEDVDGVGTIVSIVFEILAMLNKQERFVYIERNLLKIKQPHLQNLTLHRLLSYPFCVDPEVCVMLARPEACAIISRIASEVIVDKNKEKFNLLHKCFFQTDNGDILITASTVDIILRTISKPLASAELNEMVDVCGSFIAQIMPVVCSNNNSSLSVQKEIFLRLFKFTIEHMPDEEFISEDTLWELTTCWQDALSSNDIVIDEQTLLECAAIVEMQVQKPELSTAELDAMSEAIAKFIICATESIQDDTERLKRIEEFLYTLLLSSKVKTPQSVCALAQYCLYTEALTANVTVGVEFSLAEIKHVPLSMILQRTLLNFLTLVKLVCKVDEYQKPKAQEADVNDEEEVTEDYCDPNANLLKEWSDSLLAEIQSCINISAISEGLLEKTQLYHYDEELVLYLSEKVCIFMGNSSDIVAAITQRMLESALTQTDVIASRALMYLVHYVKYAEFEENATILLHEDLAEQMVSQSKLEAYVNTLQYMLPKLSQKTITLNSAIMRTEPELLWVKAAIFRCLVLNSFEAEFNDSSDHNIITSVLQFITCIAEKQATQKDLLNYNVEIHRQVYVSVINTVEYINLLTEVVKRFPYELSIKNWDAIRIGLSSWVLSIAKSVEYHSNPQTAFFVVAVYKLFAALVSFIHTEKQKSSTQLLKNVIDEWESLFAREVNIVLFKAYYAIVNDAVISDDYLACFIQLLMEITPTWEFIDYNFVYGFCKNSTQITSDNVCNFLLKNLSNPIYCLRISALYALRQLTQNFVADDIEIFDKKSESLEQQSQTTKWHYLNRFEDYLSRYDLLIRKYLAEFSFKLTELDELEMIDKHDALSYLFIWDCIIYACANSPVSLRSVYTNWLNENKYEENFLHFLFRAMPIDILKNHSAKVLSSDIFKELSWTQYTDEKLPLDRYVCHLYTEVLRKLPAVVRKWWNTSPSRQKNFVDNLTTNYVSALICNEELKAIAAKKERHENMQVTIHTSTREVLAVYAIDEARMELVITLAPNYPLGAVKVECGKQIGGRATSRNVGMQLTIFLTHQNGTIFDGLTLWKNNLDKKFEGVEECYVCYTVIHQDTCQLPKLTCKTCKKKFHGPCLYKWFTTSSKSTCPICRNVF